jgi:hypothetical protein
MSENNSCLTPFGQGCLRFTNDAGKKPYAKQLVLHHLHTMANGGLQAEIVQFSKFTPIKNLILT